MDADKPAVAGQTLDSHSVLLQYGIEQLTDSTADQNEQRCQGMATEEWVESGSPLDAVIADIRHELMGRVAAADREVNCDVYDALEDE